MILLPQGTLRRKIFEAIDRWLGAQLFTGDKTVSTDCGDQYVAGKPCLFCRFICKIVLFWADKGQHCEKNAGKP